jgi:hypothetical protein
MLSMLAAASSSFVLVMLAALHVYWAFGGMWPGQDGESLARMVVGGPAGLEMPSRAACLSVSVALLIGAGAVLTAGGLLPPVIDIELVRMLAWVYAGAFTLRGVVGFFDARLRPATRKSRFERLNLTVYSPLCLGLAASIATAARP